MLDFEDEARLVRWLFAEAIAHRNKRRPIRNKGALRWASHTRIHKILFSVLNKFDIPVTRSWYMWGGFVHSDILQGNSFTSLRYGYSKNPERALTLRKRVERLGVPIRDILQVLYEYTDEVQSMPSKDFLLRYYKSDVPEEYRHLYLSKQKLANHLHELWDLRSVNVSILKNRSNLVSKAISDFHLASLTSFEDPKLEELNIRFADATEIPLDKLALLIDEGKKISKSKVLFFKQAEYTFNYTIWNPYACKISQRTVRGIRADDERKKMKNREERTIENAPQELDKLGQERDKRNLGFSWDEVQRYKKQALRDSHTAKVLSEILNIYGRGCEGND